MPEQTPDAPLETVALSEDIAAMAFVQASALCRPLSEDQLDELIAVGTVTHHGAEALMMCEGGTDDSLYIILDGSLTVFKEHGGASVELAVLERPKVLGEVAVLTEHRRMASAVTRTETRLVCFPGGVVREIANAEPKFGRRLAALMAGRVKDAERKLSGGK